MTTTTIEGRRREDSGIVLAPLDHHQTLEDRAHAELMRAITTGSLRPGDRLSVNAMAAQLGVSRLPVLHAVRRLAGEGFVQIQPHREVLIAKPSLQELRRRTMMLIALEEVALREFWPLPTAIVDHLVATNARYTAEVGAGEHGGEADQTFHRILWTAVESETLLKTLETLWNLNSYYRQQTFREYVLEIAAERIAQHAAILAAVQREDLDGAIAALKHHRLAGLHLMEQHYI